MHHLVIDSTPQIYGFWRVELDVCIEWLLDLCDLTKHRWHLLWVAAPAGHVLL